MGIFPTTGLIWPYARRYLEFRCLKSQFLINIYDSPNPCRSNHRSHRFKFVQGAAPPPARSSCPRATLWRRIAMYNLGHARPRPDRPMIWRVLWIVNGDKDVFFSAKSEGCGKKRSKSRGDSRRKLTHPETSFYHFGSKASHITTPVPSASPMSMEISGS